MRTGADQYASDVLIRLESDRERFTAGVPAVPEDGGDEPRLGLAVPKGNGSAVVRNRVLA